MQERAFVMSVAGFDPSAGAGLLADCKTFEQLRVYGVFANTANTIQTAAAFHSIQWLDVQYVTETIRILLQEYPVRVVKTGIMPSFRFLEAIVACIKEQDETIRIVVDPVIKSSTGFDFMKDVQLDIVKKLLNNVALITPNTNEVQVLTGKSDVHQAALELANHCPVLLKGGHSATHPGTDYLYVKNNVHIFPPMNVSVYAKHGSGCVLSAAITAYLALGETIESACGKAKAYAEKFLVSNQTLLGYHHV